MELVPPYAKKHVFKQHSGKIFLPVLKYDESQEKYSSKSCPYVRIHAFYSGVELIPLSGTSSKNLAKSKSGTCSTIYWNLSFWPLESIFNINWLNFKWKLISRKRNIILKASKYAIFVRSRGGTCSTTFARRKSGTYSTRSKGGTCFTTLKSTFLV